MINSYEAGRWSWCWVKSTFLLRPSPVWFLVSGRVRIFSLLINLPFFRDFLILKEIPLISYRTAACLSSIWKIEPRTFSNTLKTFKSRLEIALVAPPVVRFTGFKNWVLLNKLTSKGNFCCREETEKHPFLNFSWPSSEIKFWANIVFAFVPTSIIRIGLTFFSALKFTLIFRQDPQKTI